MTKVDSPFHILRTGSRAADGSNISHLQEIKEFSARLWRRLLAGAIFAPMAGQATRHL
jgi:hypothetical protein